MSLRTTILRTPIASSSLRPSARLVSSTPIRRASHGHDDHHSGHSDHGSSEANTHETFFSPIWRNTFILVTASVLIYPYLPSPSNGSASPSLTPSKFASEAAPGSEAPLITRWLAKITPEAKVWTERNEKHFELSTEAAGTKLLFQEAERPRVLRLRYPASFEQASPNGIPVGSQVDLSDLMIKREE